MLCMQKEFMKLAQIYGFCNNFHNFHYTAEISVNKLKITNNLNIYYKLLL